MERAIGLFMGLNHTGRMAKRSSLLLHRRAWPRTWLWRAKSSFLKMVQERLQIDPGGRGLDAARNMLNSMMYDSVMRKDMDEVKCTQHETKALRSMKDKGDRQSSRQKALAKEYRHMMEQCRQQKNNFTQEYVALRKIRGELLTASGSDQHIA